MRTGEAFVSIKGLYEKVTSASSESMDSSLPPHNPFVSESNIQAENINPQDWYKEHKIDNEWLCQQYKDVIV